MTDQTNDTTTDEEPAAPVVYIQAVQSFGVGLRMVQRGDIIDAADPIVAGREHLFQYPGGGQVVRAAVAGPVAQVPTTAKGKTTAKAKTAPADEGGD